MIVRRKTRGGKIRYGVRVHTGAGEYDWLGTFPTRDTAKQVQARWELGERASKERADDFADFWLEGYQERVKGSSYDTANSALKAFKRDFAGRTLASLDPTEAEEWARANRWAVPPVVTMLNDAKKKKLIADNPFAGLSKKGPGRRDNEPLTIKEVDRLADGALELHGQTMASFILFAAYSGMRVGELFALEWGDVDFDRETIAVKRRVYRGTVDLPKSNKRREILLTSQARDALLPLDRNTDWIFLGKRGGRMSQSSLAYYWQGITAKFGRHIVPHELKHFCGYYLYVIRGMSSRLVAAQLAHSSPRLIEDLYGHGSVGAIDELRQALARENVIPLRAAGVDHG